jgi:hypothetical protein
MGGAAAPVSLEASVGGLRKVIASITSEDNGCLLHFDGRRADHW